MPDLGHFDDVRDVEVGGDGGQALADQVGLVGLLPVHLATVLLGVDGYGADAQLGAGAEHAHGDLTWGETRRRGEERRDYCVDSFSI